MWNMVKVDKNDIRTRSMTSLWFLIVKFEHISHLVLVFLLRFWACICLPCVTFFTLQSFLDLIFSSFIHFRKDFLEEEYLRELEYTGGDLTQWNGKCISIKFLWWNLNHEVTLCLFHYVYFPEFCLPVVSMLHLL